MLPSCQKLRVVLLAALASYASFITWCGLELGRFCIIDESSECDKWKKSFIPLNTPIATSARVLTAFMKDEATDIS